MSRPRRIGNRAHPPTLSRPSLEGIDISAAAARECQGSGAARENARIADPLQSEKRGLDDLGVRVAERVEEGVDAIRIVELAERLHRGHSDERRARQRERP